MFGFQGSSALLLAPSGSGKTAAFWLPLAEALIFRKRKKDFLPARPRLPSCVVLVPSREIAHQLHAVYVQPLQTGTTWDVGEASRRTRSRNPSASACGSTLQSCVCAGGGSLQHESRLLGGGVDLVVSTPGRLIAHLRRGTLSLRRLNALVVDEADALCDGLYSQELKKCLEIALENRTVQTAQDEGGGVQVVFASATQTQGLRDFLQNFRVPTQRRRESADADKDGESSTSLESLLQRVAVEGLHYPPPNVRQVYVPLQGESRMQRLFETLGNPSTIQQTLLFCNTVRSCR